MGSCKIEDKRFIMQIIQTGSFILDLDHDTWL